MRLLIYSQSQSQRGISLIEALVALAVMAFGMLGIVGIQSSLRYNSDVSRNRSESMRIAQESLELARAYSVVGAGLAPKVGFDDLVSQAPADVTGYITNTTYSRVITVVDAPAAALSAVTGPSVPELVYVPLLKSARVDVSWTDRTGSAQSLRVSSVIHRSPPELAGSLVVSGAGTSVQLPRGRHGSIPPAAVDQSDGTSSLAPPGAPPDVRWIYNNTTGFITQVCSTVPGCTSVTALSLQGIILFATDASQPTSTESENPPSNAFSVSTGITQTDPPIGPPSTTEVAAPQCYTQAAPASPATTRSLEYVCLVNVLSATRQWSGLALLTGMPLAVSIADHSNTTAYRVCRYTKVRSNAAVGSGTPALTNADHPLQYESVKQSLVNQNYLVIRAGDSTAAYDCPEDDPLTPFVEGRTWHHQPAT